MTTMIKTRIVKIGNSQGVRIPKLLIDQAGLTEEVNLQIEDDRIIISSSRTPRHGWQEQFQRMAEVGDDHFIDETSVSYLTSWDEDEWTW